MAQQIKASLIAQVPQNTIIKDLLALGTEVPWDLMVWGRHLDRIIGRKSSLTYNQAVEHFVDLCTVTRTPGNRGVPQEAIVFVGTRLAAQCPDLPSFEALCKALFAETKEDCDDVDISHFEWTMPCLVQVASHNNVVPRHLAFLYEQAGRPTLSHRQVVRFVSQELNILRYDATEDEEIYGDGLPLEWVRGVFDRNQTKYIDKMLTVAVFGKDRVLTALQAVHQSELPMSYANDDDIVEGETDDERQENALMR